MTKASKQYFLGYIYEEIEKDYFNAIHSKNGKEVFFKKQLEELDQKTIVSIELKNRLERIKENSRLYDLPTFIDNLIKGEFREDLDLQGKVLNFETPSFF